jgi:hypothetical protein
MPPQKCLEWNPSVAPVSNIYISSHNGLINFLHISAQHLWTELQAFGGKLAPPSYNTQNALNYKSQRQSYICMQLQRKIIYNFKKNKKPLIICSILG